jgi:ribosome-associated protein
VNQESVTPVIRLDQFLKVKGIAPTGGQAKLMIQEGDVAVNSAPETRRGRKLRGGDVVQVGGRSYVVDDLERC